jgi:hypothetical protein
VFTARIKLSATALAAGVFTLAMNSLPSLRAAPSHSEVTYQLKMVLQASMVDRARKGDRLAPAPYAIKLAPPPGCESPFSSLSKLSRSYLIARCVT